MSVPTLAILDIRMPNLNGVARGGRHHDHREHTLAARYLVVLPVLLLAAAALGGTLVRRMSGTASRRAYLFGLLAMLFLAPVPLVAKPVLGDLPFGSLVVSLIYGISLYGLGDRGPARPVWPRGAGRSAGDLGPCRLRRQRCGSHPARPHRDRAAGSRRGRVRRGDPHRALAVSDAPPTGPLTGLAAHGHRHRHRPRRDRRLGPAHGHGLGGGGGLPSSVSPSTLPGATRSPSCSWVPVCSSPSPSPGSWTGRTRYCCLTCTSARWCSCSLAPSLAVGFGDFNMFYFFFAPIAVVATPVAAVAIWTVFVARARETGHGRLALAAVLLCVIQLELGAYVGIFRVQLNGPGSNPPIPVSLLASIRQLALGTELAYACQPFEEATFGTPSLLGIDAHTGHRVVPMCFEADVFGVLIGAKPSAEVPNANFSLAPRCQPLSRCLGPPVLGATGKSAIGVDAGATRRLVAS